MDSVISLSCIHCSLTKASLLTFQNLSKTFNTFNIWEVLFFYLFFTLSKFFTCIIVFFRFFRLILTDCSLNKHKLQCCVQLLHVELPIDRKATSFIGSQT